ncbi:unnamed protein product [Diatraea saccharalis]|uniref:BZIP domain-containing protein n=1 Tax=Diatraea saccharalis TaxID=40085 RepID=A0A9N9R2I1_9NEOP|nr:unnamed protein product [Diatraea saccharalis]
MALRLHEQEAALDLSLSAIKREQFSPSVESFLNTSPNYSNFNYGRPQYIVSPNVEQYYSGYTDQALVPSAHVSPSSIDGIAHLSPPSIYEAEVSNQFQYYKPIGSAPSPPKSPEKYDTESLDDDVEYRAFERDAMRAMTVKNGGSLLGTNPRMRRIVQTNQAADDNYRLQRERNNHAAKQSRDKRRLREVRLALQVTFLKNKRDELRAMLAAGICVRCRHRSL